MTAVDNIFIRKTELWVDFHDFSRIFFGNSVDISDKLTSTMTEIVIFTSKNYWNDTNKYQRKPKNAVFYRLFFIWNRFKIQKVFTCQIYSHLSTNVLHIYTEYSYPACGIFLWFSHTSAATFNIGFIGSIRKRH